jgi:hypothetical protein
MTDPLFRRRVAAAGVALAVVALVSLVVAAAAKGTLRVPPEGVVAIGLLGAVAFVAASAERRRRQAAADPEIAARTQPEEPPLDEDTIGIIEYASPSADPHDTETDGEPA